MQSLTEPHLIILDWKEFSGGAFDELKGLCTKLGLHCGDAEQELYGSAMSDTYHIYVWTDKLPKEELEKFMYGEED